MDLLITNPSRPEERCCRKVHCAKPASTFGSLLQLEWMSVVVRENQFVKGYGLF